MTHQMAADAVGRSVAATDNLLRLLQLSPLVREMLIEADLEIGHASALLALDEAAQIAVANKIIQGGLSVRAAEKIVQLELGNTIR